jgi:hypothetical protein
MNTKKKGLIAKKNRLTNSNWFKWFRCIIFLNKILNSSFMNEIYYY